MSSFGENYKKNDLLDDIQHYFSDGGTIEEMFDVLRYIFEYGKTPFDDLIQKNQKYKEVIDKVIEEVAIIIRDCEESDDEDDLGPSLNDLNYILDILKGVE